jgi:hypothetical protein
MSLFIQLRDKAASIAGSIILKKKIERYGSMLDFKIDSEKKKIFLRVSLKGELQPVDIIIEHYSLKKQGEEDIIITIESVTVSKEWMNLLAADLLRQKEFKIPPGITSTLAQMLL